MQGEFIQGPTMLVKYGDSGDLYDYTCDDHPEETTFEDIDCLCECYRKGFGWFWYYNSVYYWCSCGAQFNGMVNPGKF